jgi:hypothetical protein
MRFIITAQACADNEEPDAGGDLDEALLTAYMRFNEEMHKAGVLVASEGLNPAAPGARIAVSKGKRYIVDGPFAESKELVGGFYIIEVGSLEEAISWTLRAPSGLGADDVLEVRQLTGADDVPPDVLAIIRAAAPTWSESVWQARSEGHIRDRRVAIQPGARADVRRRTSVCGSVSA